MRARAASRAQIVMPLMTPLVKVAATKGFGAEVVLHGANYDEAYSFALESCAEQGMTFLHPFDDAEVINGQGSIGLELLEQVPDLEAVVVPIGGGGLISGVACAIKESNPKIRVDRGADGATAVDAAGDRGGASGDDSGVGNGGRRHCGAARRRPDAAAGAALRR